MSAGTLRVYGMLLRAALTGQATYRASFAVELLGSALVIGLDFVEVFAVFTQVPRLAGFDFAEVFLVFGLASAAFSLADLVLGQTDRVSDHVRTGTFDVVLLRPLSTLGQLAAADLQLRRLGRLVTAVAVLGLALGRLDVDWTPARVVRWSERRWSARRCSARSSSPPARCPSGWWTRARSATR